MGRFTRRAFLRQLAQGAAALATASAVIDPERLAWEPGQRTYVLPPPQGWRQTELGLYDIEVDVGPGDVSFSEWKRNYEYIMCSPDMRGLIEAEARQLARTIDAQAAQLFAGYPIQVNPALPHGSILLKYHTEQRFYWEPLKSAVITGIGGA